MPVVASPVLRPRKRTIYINQSWGRPCYLVKFEEHTIRVMRPSWAEQKNGCLFHFEWLPESTIAAYENPAPQIVIARNDREAARIFPVWEHLAAISYHRTSRVPIAEIYTDSMSLQLVCDVICNYFPSRFRVLSSEGLRFCYWRRTGGFRGGAKLVVSKRVDSELLPIIVAIVTAMLMDSGGD